MNAIRSALVFAWIVLSVIPVGIALLLFSLVLDDKKLWWWFAVPWLKGVIVAARLVGGVQYRLHGEERLPAAEDMRRVILCPKHQSTWETFYFPSMTSHPLAYVFKQELLRIPIFGWCMARLNMIHIDRSRRSEAWARVADQGRVLMDGGKWVIMFPEGTRTERGAQGVVVGGPAHVVDPHARKQWTVSTEPPASMNLMVYAHRSDGETFPVGRTQSVVSVVRSSLVGLKPLQ